MATMTKNVFIDAVMETIVPRRPAYPITGMPIIASSIFSSTVSGFG